MNEDFSGSSEKERNSPRLVFHWNETLAALEPKDGYIRSRISSGKFYVDAEKSDIPDRMPPDYTPKQGEVYLGRMEDLQLQWKKAKEDAQIIDWLKRHSDKISPGFDGRTVLVTLIVKNGIVTYSFSANYRTGGTYLYPLPDNN